jgi:RHS repeat-associated protein
MPVTNFRNVAGRILAQSKVGVSTEYLLDPLGSVIGTSTSAGVVSNRTTCWPYGEVRTGGVASVTPFGVCGGWGYYTDSSGSLYVRARYFRSALTRWQTVDPLWPIESTYGYVGGQTVNGADPSGQQVWYDPSHELEVHPGSPEWPTSPQIENIISCGCYNASRKCMKESDTFRKPGAPIRSDMANALGHCFTACCIKRRLPGCVWYWTLRDSNLFDPSTCMDNWNNNVGYGCASGTASCYACCLNKINDLTWLVPIRHNFPPPGRCGWGASGGTGKALVGGMVRGGTSPIWE